MYSSLSDRNGYPRVPDLKERLYMAENDECTTSLNLLLFGYKTEAIPGLRNYHLQKIHQAEERKQNGVVDMTTYYPRSLEPSMIRKEITLDYVQRDPIHYIDKP